MNKHDVFQGVPIYDLNEEGVFIACLFLKFNDVTVCVIYVLIV